MSCKSRLADLSAFIQAHPVQNPEEEDFEPDGTWYSMIAANNALFAVEPNHGELDRITTKGKVSRIVDISASQGHIVPTSVDYFRGNFFVGNLTTFPLVQGAAKIMEINKGGHIKAMLCGLTNIVSAMFDADGNLYILESTTGNPMPTPDTGVVVKVTLSGQKEILASGLSLPTAMTFGPDGALYVSNKGFGYPPGMGEVVRIALGN
jgi:sugar lactone lactonase YvrE